MECVSPRHLPPASELPYLLTYSRPPSNTTGFHRATRSRSSSSRRSAPGDSHPTLLHHDGYHLAVSAATPTHYLPETLCARAPTLSAEPQIFPTDSTIAATPSIAIWLGWLPRQRHRSILDTAPPTFGPSGYTPSALFLAHYRRPSRNLRIAGISEISSAPFANTAPPPPAWYQLGDPHRLLRRRRPPNPAF